MISKIHFISINYTDDGEISSIYIDYSCSTDPFDHNSGYGEGLVNVNGVYKKITEDKDICKFIIEEFKPCPKEFIDYAFRIRKTEFYEDVLNE